MTFTAKQQKEHREEFIKECRQKAWSAACHANWIGDQLDKLIEDYAKLKKDDEAAEAEIKTLETALDYHTVENRAKRKALQERRNALAKQMEAVGGAMQQGQRGLNDLHQSIEANLQLAKHAEMWEWKEVVDKSA
jgi:chromosome segregation ATPase